LLLIRVTWRILPSVRLSNATVGISLNLIVMLPSARQYKRFCIARTICGGQVSCLQEAFHFAPSHTTNDYVRPYNQYIAVIICASSKLCTGSNLFPTQTHYKHICPPTLTYALRGAICASSKLCTGSNLFPAQTHYKR